MKPVTGIPQPVRAAAGAAAPPNARTQAKLRAAADELQALFMSQLFQAMRASVPQDGIIERSSAEENFTQMLDEMVARQAAARMRGGVGEAMYQQLLRRLTPDDASGE